MSAFDVRERIREVDEDFAVDGIQFVIHRRVRESFRVLTYEYLLASALVRVRSDGGENHSILWRQRISELVPPRHCDDAAGERNDRCASGEAVDCQFQALARLLAACDQSAENVSRLVNECAKWLRPGDLTNLPLQRPVEFTSLGGAPVPRRTRFRGTDGRNC